MATREKSTFLAAHAVLATPVVEMLHEGVDCVVQRAHEEA